jgi:hypothetical protein
MADFFQTSNRQPDTGRSFVSSILSKLPYVQQTIEADVNNPRYELFDRLSKRKELRLMQQSVITGPYMKDVGDSYSPNSFVSDQAYHKYIYAQVDTDKTRRLAEYRRMAAYAEVGDCLDEICDEFVNKDENGKVIKIQFSSFSKLENKERSELEKEFYKFVNVFDFENKGWGYCRQLLVEGEVFFENIIHEAKKELGIIGVLSVPSELINPVYDNVQNNVVQNFVFQKPISLQQNPAAQLSPSNFQPPTPANALQQQIVTFQGNQVTYVNSGLWNEDMTMRVPFIENARRAYKQLSLIEDSIVIYRMVRAPERLKFKIDVGNMPPAKAEAYLRQLMQSYWNKKSYDSNKGQSGAANIYDPQSMLDSYWFAKRSGEQGSDVELMQGGQNLGELKDLMYFVNKLYKSLKVPLTRLNPEEGYKDGAEILREELRFAKFIVRLQSQFAEGIKNAFITHLKIRNWWKDYKLHESYFNLEFNPPSNFFAIRKNQEFELKFKIFNDMSQNESISKTFAQRHYLEYNDSRISENMEWLRKDAALKWELEQIATTGPNWREHIQAAEDASTEGGGGEMGGGGTSASEIPEFGETGGGEAAETPEAEAGTEGGGETTAAETAAPETPTIPTAS